MKLRQTDETRFWSKVDFKGPDDCWEWKASKSNTGYGSFRINHVTFNAHRLCYILKFGEIENRSLMVCHKCDNRACCNWNHLFLGSAKDNTHDMTLKGRSVQKLNTQQVERIIELYNTGNFTQQKLAEMFNCDQTSVSLYIKRVRLDLQKPVSGPIKDRATGQLQLTA